MTFRAELTVYGDRVARRRESWRTEGAARRIWAKDPTFWPAADPSDVRTRLGWLTLPEEMREVAAEIREFAGAVRDEGFQQVVLLGMGGSSLAPQVYGATFGSARGYPALHVLDSTHPSAVEALARSLDPRRTLFVVSSKSGSTLEPNAFFRFFYAKVAERSNAPGANFVAITDPGTPLERLAAERKFRRCFRANPDVGGRYSALTHFGLVPAGLIGVDLDGLLASGRAMAKACASPEANPGLELGAIVGELALAGRDKVSLLASPELLTFPDWAEQLIAESTGKQGRGIVPVAREVIPLETDWGGDVLIADLAIAGGTDRRKEEAIGLWVEAGHPIVRTQLADLREIGGEFYRWEFAIAAAGAVLGIDPFDQPDVEFAKELAREAMRRPAATSPGAGATVPVGDRAALGAALDRWSGSARPGDYVAIQAYVAPSAALEEALGAVRGALRQHLKLSTTLGFGPRFLHSTGQLHKGGPPTGLFLQLTDRPASDLAVPEMEVTFGRIIQAQAVGDAAALRQRERRVVSIDLGSDPAGGLAALLDAVHG